MLRTLALAVFLTMGVLSLQANPTGGDVTAGSAQISGQGSAAVTINQASSTAIINWNTFSIASGESTSFLQPVGGATLNRVTGGQTSFINGTLSATGQIYLINGNGVIVGSGGVISANGFTASTRDIADSDFLAGKLHFVGDSEAGIKNNGTIKALGGDVVLIGKTVTNNGTIEAPSGTAGLVAGDDVLLAQQNDDGSTITVNPVANPAAPTKREKVGVKNKGTIRAAAAELKAANGNIYALAIQNEGLVQATTVTHQGGHVFLTSDDGTIENSGTIDASATAAKGQGGSIVLKSAAGKVVHTGKIVAQGGQGGTGGNVDFSGQQFNFTGTVDLTAPGGTTGNLLLDPAFLEVEHNQGGGSVTSSGTGTGTQTYTNNQTNPNATTINDTLINSTLIAANLTLEATSGITVDSNVAISWNTANTLAFVTDGPGATTLTFKAGSSIVGTSGTLAITMANAGDLIDARGSVNVSSFLLYSGAWKQLSDENDNGADNGGNIPKITVGQTSGVTAPLPAFTAANDFEISSDASFLRAQGGNGSGVYYALIDIYGLQGINGFLNSNFTSLSGTINATTDAAGNTVNIGNWNGQSGFAPIGFGSAYDGAFSNTTVENLTINSGNDDVGLVSILGANGQLNGITVQDSSITGNAEVGALAGENYGEIHGGGNEGTSVTGQTNVGGVVGFNHGYIGPDDTYSYGGPTFYGTVTGVTNVGGIAGANDGPAPNGIGSGTSTGTISNAYSYGTVNGSTDLGGIAGLNRGFIQYGESSAQISGDTNVGGVAGENSGTIDNLISEAALSGADDEVNSQIDFGGIVGINDYGTATGAGVISNSYFRGAGSFSPADGIELSNVGGIAGRNNGQIVYSDVLPGAVVQGNEAVGGIAGYNLGLIEDCYNSGGVSGLAFGETHNDEIGGIAGYNNGNQQIVSSVVMVFSVGPSTYDQAGIIENSYNSGTVTGRTAVGGVVGYNDTAGTITTAYNVGTVTGRSNVGGIAGYNDGSIQYVYNSGAISGTGTSTGTGTGTGTGSGTVGALIGFEDADSSLSNAYWDSSTSNRGSSVGTSNGGDELVASVTSSTAYTQAGNDGETGAGYGYFGDSTAVGNDVYQIGGTSPDGGATSWYILEGQTRPMLAMEYNQIVENSGTLQSPHQLQLMEVNLSNTYYLNSNLLEGSIDLSATNSASEVWGPGGFAPIGNQYTGADETTMTAFSGTFYGNSVTLQNLFIDTQNDASGPYGPESDLFTGFFGAVAANGNVNGFTLQDASVTGSNEVGGVAGDNAGLVQNITVAGGTISGDTSVGGLVGRNESTGTIQQTANSSSVDRGVALGFGGIAGENDGRITQSVNTGNIGMGTESDVGGLVGYNTGQIDDSYSGTYLNVDEQNVFIGTVSGSNHVGGLVGLNDTTGIVESSYSVSPVSGGAFTGALVGQNLGTVRHSYWNSDESTIGIGSSSGSGSGTGTGTGTGLTTDVVGYSYNEGQLSDERNFSGYATNGPAPGQWNFAPPATQYGTGGAWAINEYYNNGEDTTQVDGGLPVLQWQNPVAIQIAAPNGTFEYGYDIPTTSTITGYGASQFSTVMPNGFSFSVNGGSDAGDTQQITLSGNPAPGYAVEFVPGTVNVVPDDVYITANSYNIPSGSSAPDFSATYTGFTANTDPSYLDGTLTYTLTPTGVADGVHQITPGGLTSPIGDAEEANFNLHFINGILNVGSATPSQQQQTVEAELQNIQNFFKNDPTTGLDPIYFIIFPNLTGLSGDLLGAINNEPDATDYAYASGTSNLPSFDRLATPGTGVIQIVNGFVVVGDPATGHAIYLSNPGGALPADVTEALRDLLSPASYNQLLLLTNGGH